jgi:hypothetical protein
LVKALAPVMVMTATAVTSWAKETIFALDERFRVVKEAEGSPSFFVNGKKSVDGEELVTEGGRYRYIYTSGSTPESPTIRSTSVIKICLALFGFHS